MAVSVISCPSDLCVVELIANQDEGASTLETRESLQSLAIELTENHVAEGVIVTESGENRVSSLHHTPRPPRSFFC